MAGILDGQPVLPDLDDAWVADATEFETVDELLADTRELLADQQTRSCVTVPSTLLAPSWAAFCTSARSPCAGNRWAARWI